MGSSRKKIFLLSKIFSNFKISIVSSVGQKTLSIFLDANFHKYFLIKLNFGKPEILNTNLVSNLQNINSINGM